MKKLSSLENLSNNNIKMLNKITILVSITKKATKRINSSKKGNDKYIIDVIFIAPQLFFAAHVDGPRRAWSTQI